ncbi:MAG: RNB domain-containing ribonuclease, partial [Candidatus Yonathbacteria bacterium]|nr:RNB domain-containing ribonuclease [Candidatus Yonathbacteria bacterium]
EAQKIIDEKEGVLVRELLILNTIAEKIEKQNVAEGQITFTQDEVKFVLDENKKPVSVYRKQAQDTNKLVEEFMLLANKKVAEFVAKKVEMDSVEGLFVYRIHDQPDPERLTTLATYLKRLGYKLPVVNGRISSQDINKLLAEVKGKPEESMVQTSVIRTMAKAIYSANNIGHYGLSLRFYTHFTSPIRRYPDVMVHRILAHYLEDKKISYEELNEYRKLSAHSSEMEGLAKEAERASIKFKQAEYMSTRIGQEFEGAISGVAEFGIFVEEQETKCEGIIRLSDIGNDYFIFENENYRIIGKNTRKSYTLGDKIRVRVKGVDLERKSIDYELIKDSSKK